MAYVQVPKDLNAVKTKILFGLTKRQLICFGSGALIGVPLYFLLKGSANLSASGASLCMALTHPIQHDYCINKLGCGRVLDYLHVPYAA